MRAPQPLKLAVLVGAVALAGCSGGSSDSGVLSRLTGTSPPEGGINAVATAGGQKYLSDYELVQADASMIVTVVDGVRTIEANGVPNHTIGRFPNPNDPYAFTPRPLTVSLPTVSQPTTSPQPTRVSGIAINGVRFEPISDQHVDCASGESYDIEAIGGRYNLGLDNNNANVQADGDYVYRGIPQLLVDANAGEQDLVLLGFAPDGYLIYYSQSGAYRPGYTLTNTTRTGTGCRATVGNTDPVDLDGTAPDGSFTSDWEWDPDHGDLDECNGVEIDGQYAYIVTAGYPFVGRCLKGEFDTTQFGAIDRLPSVPPATNTPTIPPTVPPTVPPATQPPTIPPTVPPTVPPATQPPTIPPTVPPTVPPTAPPG